MSDPWLEKAKELEPEQGPWAYYNVYNDWMNEQMSEPCASSPCHGCFYCQVAEAWGETDELLKVAIFNAVLKAIKLSGDDGKKGLPDGVYEKILREDEE